MFDELPALEHYHENIQFRYGSISVHPPVKQKIFYNEEPVVDEKYVQHLTLKKKEKEEEVPLEFETEVIKTAVCIEVRDEILYVFLPPVDSLEQYLDLIASIEATAAKFSARQLGVLKTEAR